MKKILTFVFLAAITLGTAVSCNQDKMEDIPEFANETNSQKKVNFDVLVTRDGKVVTKSWPPRAAA